MEFGDSSFSEIPGSEGNYLINMNGDIYSRISNRLLKTHLQKNGRRSVSIILEGKRVHCGVDSLIRKTFPEDLTSFKEIPFTDGDYLININGEVYSKRTNKLFSNNCHLITVRANNGVVKSFNRKVLAKRLFRDGLPEMKPIKDTDDMYEATKDGRIYSHYSEDFLSGGYGNSGYLQVVIIENGKQRTRMIHRLIAETWIDNPDNLPEVDHVNMDKSDNRVSNLEWVTGLENTRRAFAARKLKEVV